MEAILVLLGLGTGDATQANMLTNAWAQHGLLLVFVAWPFISMVLNALLRKKTPEQWVEYANQNPRMAGVIRLLSALGFDPAKGIRAVKQIVKGAADDAHTKNPKLAKIVDSVTADEENPQ